MRRRLFLFFPPISDVFQLNFIFTLKKHLCHESSELASSVDQTGCFWSWCTTSTKIVTLTKALTLIMLLVLAEGFPGGCGAHLHQRPLLQLALPNRSGCCAASLSCHTWLLPPLLWQCHENCPGFNTSPTPRSPFGPYGWTHPSTDLTWSVVRGREKEDLRWERPCFCVVHLLVCVLRCAICS